MKGQVKYLVWLPSELNDKMLEIEQRTGMSRRYQIFEALRDSEEFGEEYRQALQESLEKSLMKEGTAREG